MKNDNLQEVNPIHIIITAIIIIALLVWVAVYAKNHPVIYEITITDMYTDIGSNFHIIGGRASETEYHVTYTYKNADDIDAQVSTYETTVEGSTYRKLQVGQTFTKQGDFILY